MKLRAKRADGYVTTDRRRLDSMSNFDRDALSQWMKEEQGSCEKCGSTENMTIDHISPVWKTTQGDDGQWYNPDGTHMDDSSNLQVLCGACNDAKMRKDVSDYRMVHSFLGEQKSPAQNKCRLENNLRSSIRKDEQAFRVQGMLGGGASWGDVMRIRSIKSKTTLNSLRKRKLDEYGRSATTRRLEQQILSY